MRLNDFDFEITRDPWNLYISDKNYGNLGYEGYHDWNILQLRYLLCVLFEYTATLGLIDIAYIAPDNARHDYSELWGTDDLDFLSRYDGLMLFRINALGAYCLGLEEGYHASNAEKKEVLQIFPNLDIVAIHSVSPTDSVLLDQFTDKRSDSIWNINEKKLLDALEQGRDLSHFTDLLRNRCAEELLKEVTQLLQDVKDRSQQLMEQGTAQLIECDNPKLAKLIANDKQTKRFCLLAGERFLVVPKVSEKNFRSAIKKCGYIISKKK